MTTSHLSAAFRENVLSLIPARRIIAIVRGVFGADALKLARALHAGGVDLLEVTFDQSSEEKRAKTVETIRLLTETLGGEMCFGAGTVTSVEMVREAREAGAQFIISPNTDAAVIRETRALGMVSIPGAFTPTEIFEAARAGGDFVKVFPADAVGPAYFKSIMTPLNHVRLLAVGGVNPANVRAFLDAGAVGAGVSGALTKKEWVAAGAWEKVTEAAKSLLITALSD
ncbi:MAG: bifunctional 4-hydroxy-2-oxoglutarate aldolase/2-dehydro-3-deoxy-phosphogluconate aldolase [Lachnospiraceae bacterium]|nr:bifunctional 4-hydroxy-2-oxoglutarate aldolase/2-dehydro-3-deoxy-phosphogluconate aldolase [Lachnospiraceae bacterium]